MLNRGNPARFSWVRGVLVVFAIATVISGAYSQARTRRRPAADPNAAKAEDVPFPLIQKRINFKLVPLDKTKFLLMSSQVAILPTGFGGKLKAPQPVVSLEYGSRKGGVGWVFETLAVPGTTPDAFMKLVQAARIFRDNSGRPTWKSVAQTQNGTFFIAGSADAGYVELATASIKAIH